LFHRLAENFETTYENERLGLTGKPDFDALGKMSNLSLNDGSKMLPIESHESKEEILTHIRNNVLSVISGGTG
jgi:hypothetical protein